MTMADQSTGTREHREHTLTTLPKEGHHAVGEFFWTKWAEAVQEKERLHLPERWLDNYRLFRGKHWERQDFSSRISRKKLSVNLFFANVQRTVANITARAPIAEVIDIDGNKDDLASEALTMQVKKWNNEGEQGKSLSSSVLNMEIYGITTEKAVYSPDKEETTTVVCDPFAFSPAPGFYEELNDCPYVCHAYPMEIEFVERLFNVKGKVEGEEALNTFGVERENNRPIPTGTTYNSANYPGNFSDTPHPVKQGLTTSSPALVVEVWIRDWTKEKTSEPLINPATGQPVINPETGEIAMIETTRDKYPGGIRVVTLTNRGKLVLADRPNPNVNPEIPRELTSNTYLYDHFPFYKANSYEDTSTIWGFSAAEQVGDINLKINEMITRLGAYLSRVTLPPLIIPQDSGITRSQVNNKPGLTLWPISTGLSQGIRFLEVPNLPNDFFKALEFYIQFFDRISQIEDADRGVAPSGVIAAQAIAALQERGAVMIRAKIRAVDYLVRQRGRCAISFFQNFGQKLQSVEVSGEQLQLQGVQLIGRQFNYVVESGSTIAKTTLQVQEQAVNLYREGAIDRRALLETLNFPGWKDIIERAGEGQVDQALQILISAGLDEDMAMQLREFVMQPGQGPGDTKESSGEKEEKLRKSGPTKTEARPASNPGGNMN